MDDRPRRIAAFDIDGTLLRWSLLIYLTRELARLGIIESGVLPEVERLQREWENRQGSYTPFVRAIVKIYEAHLPGLRVEDVRTISRYIVHRDGQRVNVFTRELLRALQECGYATVAISGSNIEIVEPFAALWGFERALGTVYPIGEDGRFTGDLSKKIVYLEQKGDAFAQLMDELECGRGESVAVGDTTSDLSLLERADCPIAVNPTDALFLEACQHGIPVVTERKNNIMKLCYVLPFDDRQFDAPFVFEDHCLRGAKWSEILPPDVAENLRKRIDAYRKASA